MHQPGRINPACFAASSGDGGAIGRPVIVQRVKFSGNHNGGWQVGKIVSHKRVEPWIIRQFLCHLRPVKSGRKARGKVILQVRTGQQRCICVGDKAAAVPVRTNRRIDQQLANDMGVKQRLCRCCSQIAASAVAAQNNRPLPVGADRAGNGNSIVKHRRVPVFWCQAVIDGNDVKTRAGADFGAHIIMALQPANNKAATMKIDNLRPLSRLCCCTCRSGGIIRIMADRHMRDPTVMRPYAGRAPLIEDMAHRIIVGALPANINAARIIG